MQVDGKIIENIVKTKWRNGCPMCGAKNWGADPNLWSPMGYDPSAVQIGGPALPLAAIICQNCHTCQFVSMLAAGQKPA